MSSPPWLQHDTRTNLLSFGEVRCTGWLVITICLFLAIWAAVLLRLVSWSRSRWEDILTLHSFVLGLQLLETLVCLSELCIEVLKMSLVGFDFALSNLRLVDAARSMLPSRTSVQRGMLVLPKVPSWRCYRAPQKSSAQSLYVRSGWMLRFQRVNITDEVGLPFGLHSVLKLSMAMR